MESNDSPEIPDRGETSDIPGLPSGDLGHEKSEYLRLNEENEKENSGEGTRRGMEELYRR